MPWTTRLTWPTMGCVTVGKFLGARIPPRTTQSFCREFRRQNSSTTSKPQMLWRRDWICCRVWVLQICSQSDTHGRQPNGSCFLTPHAKTTRKLAPELSPEDPVRQDLSTKIEYLQRSYHPTCKHQLSDLNPVFASHVCRCKGHARQCNSLVTFETPLKFCRVYRLQTIWNLSMHVGSSPTKIETDQNGTNHQ